MTTSPPPPPPASARSKTLHAYTEVLQIYNLFLKDKKVGWKTDDRWEGLGASLPCVVFRTLYKAKRYGEALPYLEDAITAKKWVECGPGVKKKKKRV